MELLNPELLLPGKYRVRFLQTADHNIFITHQYVNLFYECFCLRHLI